MAALRAEQADERVAAALRDENAYWRTPEVRMQAIRLRYLEALRRRQANFSRQ